MLHPTQLENTESYDIRIWKCTNFSRHWHSRTEIYICTKGRLKIEIEGIIYNLSRGEGVFVLGNEAHEIFCNTPDTEAVLISFGYELLGSDYSRIRDITLHSPSFDMKSGNVSPALLAPLLRIRDGLQRETGSVSSDWRLKSGIYEIALYMYEYGIKGPVRAERLMRAKHLEKMYGVLQYISENFREQITVEEAATVAGYERSYFCKQFRKTTGETFHKYLNYCRLTEARRLMEDAKLPLSEVAERSGFASQKNLSRLFRETLGITPTRYRRLSEKEKIDLKPLLNDPG